MKTEKAIKKVLRQTVWFWTKECEEKTSSPQNYVHSDANEGTSNNCTQDNIIHADLLAAIQDMGSLIKNDVANLQQVVVANNNKS
jgi:hypothetical protein